MKSGLFNPPDGGQLITLSSDLSQVISEEIGWGEGTLYRVIRKTLSDSWGAGFDLISSHPPLPVLGPREWALGEGRQRLSICSWKTVLKSIAPCECVSQGAVSPCLDFAVCLSFKITMKDARDSRQAPAALSRSQCEGGRSHCFLPFTVFLPSLISIQFYNGFPFAKVWGFILCVNLTGLGDAQWAGKHYF